MKQQKLVITKKASLVLAAFILAFGVLYQGLVTADNFDAQIRVLQGQNNEKKEQSNQLLSQAASYEDAVNRLQQEIATIQAKIVELDAQKVAKEAEIAAAEAELEKQKVLLGESIKTIYLEGRISTLEMLATSKDLSEFIDKQENRETVKTKIKTTVDKVTMLKNELRLQKEFLDRLIIDQQRLRGEVSSQQAEQQRLLSLTQAEKDAVDSVIKSNNAQIADLRKQQAAANAARFGSRPNLVVDPSGYPWGGVNPFPSYVVDSWGMYARQCVSYTAFKVDNSGRYMPQWGGRGNANQWDDNARRMGIAVDGNPRVGDVAQTDNGPYGHVMYVEAVYGDGRILVSQYNFNNTGEYSEMVISARGLEFIHF